MQFLIEAVTLSVVGAAIGLAGGVGLVKLIAGFFPAGLPVSLFGTTVSVGFAIFIGLLAGLYPSISASRLEPVEALRASRPHRSAVPADRLGITAGQDARRLRAGRPHTSLWQCHFERRPAFIRASRGRRTLRRPGQ